MSVGRFLQQAAAGAGGVSVDDVFSTYLYNGTGTSFSGPGQTITNGIDLAGEGGMVWLKARNSAQHNLVIDTVRGGENRLITNSADAAGTDTGYHISNFNSDGFSLQANGTGSNRSAYNYASWTFRKQPGFFDVVTYTGTGSAQTINHSLGSAPGMIIVKDLNVAYNWMVYHRSLGGYNYYLHLNTTNVRFNNSSVWQSEPTNSTFSVGHPWNNNNGSNYVAYLFAHDAQDFGGQSIIKCGSYGPGTESLDGPEVTLGWEPQWLLTKAYSPSGYAGDWVITDNVRGVVTNGDDKFLRANLTNAELTAELVNFTSTGFKIRSYYAYMNQNPLNYIYVAIAKGS